MTDKEKKLADDVVKPHYPTPNKFGSWQCEDHYSKVDQPIKCDHSKRHYHWRNTSEYQMEYCPVCSHIRNFWFKSFWKRLRSLFKNETL